MSHFENSSEKAPTADPPVVQPDFESGDTASQAEEANLRIAGEAYNNYLATKQEKPSDFTNRLTAQPSEFNHEKYDSAILNAARSGDINSISSILNEAAKNVSLADLDKAVADINKKLKDDPSTAHLDLSLALKHPPIGPDGMVKSGAPEYSVVLKNEMTGEVTERRLQTDPKEIMASNAKNSYPPGDSSDTLDSADRMLSGAKTELNNSIDNYALIHSLKSNEKALAKTLGNAILNGDFHSIDQIMKQYDHDPQSLQNAITALKDTLSKAFLQYRK